ncbi:MAG: hemerythrin domain-containing protein [Ignavibacteriae bacterium]|nr:hemerythrin domain-containing protein [Ignavibacteriota bacterium]
MNQSTITNYYEDDHDRLDNLFKQFQSLKRNELPRAKEFFLEFHSGLLRHIMWEEEILFPLFEQKTGMHHSGPTEVMRMEHRVIKKHLEAIHTAIQSGNPETDSDEQTMLNTLFAHNQKEEQILYPAIDRTINSNERVTVFQKMETVSQ